MVFLFDLIYFGAYLLTIRIILVLNACGNFFQGGSPGLLFYRRFTAYLPNFPVSDCFNMTVWLYSRDIGLSG
jgi:hypothetical protein